MIFDVRMRLAGPDQSVLDTVPYRFVGSSAPSEYDLYRAACELRRSTPGCEHVFVMHASQPWAYASTLAGPPS